MTRILLALIASLTFTFPAFADSLGQTVQLACGQLLSPDKSRFTYNKHVAFSYLKTYSGTIDSSSTANTALHVIIPEADVPIGLDSSSTQSFLSMVTSVVGQTYDSNVDESLDVSSLNKAGVDNYVPCIRTIMQGQTKGLAVYVDDSTVDYVDFSIEFDPRDVDRRTYAVDGFVSWIGADGTPQKSPITSRHSTAGEIPVTIYDRLLVPIHYKFAYGPPVTASGPLDPASKPLVAPTVTFHIRITTNDKNGHTIPVADEQINVAAPYKVNSTETTSSLTLVDIPCGANNSGNNKNTVAPTSKTIVNSDHYVTQLTPVGTLQGWGSAAGNGSFFGASPYSYNGVQFQALCQSTSNQLSGGVRAGVDYRDNSFSVTFAGMPSNDQPSAHTSLKSKRGLLY